MEVMAVKIDCPVRIESDPEVIIRSIIALIVICLDPLAIFLLAAVNSLGARRR